MCIYSTSICRGPGSRSLNLLDLDLNQDTLTWENNITSTVCASGKSQTPPVIYAVSHLSIEKFDVITKTGLICSLSWGVNVYWSRKTWACKFWFVCVCCLAKGSCRVESITIGMWTWLLESLWKSHRPMIKNSVQASLQPHHSECLYKGPVDCKKTPLVAGLHWHINLGLALSPTEILMSGLKEHI